LEIKRKKMGKIQMLLKIFYGKAIKKNEIMSFAEKWIKLEIIMLSKISEAPKAKYPMFLFICGS
jgi:hypothetical protein